MTKTECIALEDKNISFLEEMAQQEDLSSTDFLNELLEKMRDSPRPRAGWLADGTLGNS